MSHVLKPFIQVMNQVVGCFFHSSKTSLADLPMSREIFDSSVFQKPLKNGDIEVLGNVAFRSLAFITRVLRQLPHLYHFGKETEIDLDI